ncbi:minor tail protein [Rhodococcus phage Trogglehumper]|uniref:Minor tail protein n=1 Tax=Rhodococcus phage Trogglehumper TaxID=3038381 RepID=A0AAF0GIG9_9CAUD|nr:minor tail protein [Rhodococcus phage Trogglehumper]
MSKVNTARTLADKMKAVAREAIEELRPSESIATVQMLPDGVTVGIDTAKRKAYVLIQGDTTPVWLPYMGVAPSTLGQEVKVGGGRHDRHIIDVKGTTGQEAALNEEVRKSEPAICGVKLVANFSVPGGGIPKRIPFTTSTVDLGTALEFDSANAAITCLEPGWFECWFATANDGGDGGDQTNYGHAFYMAVLPYGGTQFDIGETRTDVMRDSSGQILEPVHLNKGDKVYMNTYTPLNNVLKATCTRLTVKLTRRD